MDIFDVAEGRRKQRGSTEAAQDVSDGALSQKMEMWERLGTLVNNPAWETLWHYFVERQAGLNHRVMREHLSERDAAFARGAYAEIEAFSQWVKRVQVEAELAHQTLSRRK